MPDYEVRLDYVFEGSLDVKVTSDSEDEAMELAKEMGDIGEAHAEASHYKTLVNTIEEVSND